MQALAACIQRNVSPKSVVLEIPHKPYRHRAYKHVLANISRSSYIAIATQPVHRLQIRQQCTTRGHPLPLPQVTSGSVQYCRHAAADNRQTDRQTHRHTIHFSSSPTREKCNKLIHLSTHKVTTNGARPIQDVVIIFLDPDKRREEKLSYKANTGKAKAPVGRQKRHTLKRG